MNRKTVQGHLASLIVLGALLALAAGSSDSQPRESEPTTVQSSSTPTGERQISGESRFGCTDREYFDKLIRYAVQDDKEAFGQALAAGILSGVCTMFTNGETVFIADTAIFSGLVKVRRRGQTAEYWTNLEAVD